VNRRARTHQKVDEEIRREKAAALGRAGERLELALADVRGVAARLDAAAHAGERERLLAAYEAARLRVRDARLALVIQREAIGLRHHAVVDQLFPEPPRRAPRGMAPPRR
jgi:hypothetical protein